MMTIIAKIAQTLDDTITVMDIDSTHVTGYIIGKNATVDISLEEDDNFCEIVMVSLDLDISQIQALKENVHKGLSIFNRTLTLSKMINRVEDDEDYLKLILGWFVLMKDEIFQSESNAIYVGAD